MNFDQKLDQYAKLIVEVGANVQAGEPVRIGCPISGAEFARLLAKHAYARGASEVVMDWTDDALTLMHYENAAEEVLETVPQWQVDKSKYYFKKGVNIIRVIGTDPALLKDIAPERVLAASKARNMAFKPLDHYTMNDVVSWSIAAIPTIAWAEMVFPDLKGQAAMDALWDLIFQTTRMDLEDPVAAWQDHIKNLNRHATRLNQAKLSELHFKSANGTDLTIGMPKGHIWMSAGSKNAKGTSFVPNMPTEEVFTMPHRDGANGIVYATKPLSYNGNLIDGFWLRFEKGVCVDFGAEIGYETLKNLLAEDENGKRLGEVALVPWDSPIRASGVLFYNTLFDENAACHLAFGKAYPTTLEGGADMDAETLEAHGVNDSLIHVDFMIGSEDMEITGTTESGEKLLIFKDGNWAR